MRRQKKQQNLSPAWQRLFLIVTVFLIFLSLLTLLISVVGASALALGGGL